MLRVSPKLTSQSGVSLVELLVVIVVIAIVASLALMQRGSANEQFQRQNASRELKVAFERARFDSVKRRADPSGSPAIPASYVVVNSNSFTLFTDVNQDGDLADAEDAVTMPFASGVSVTPRSGLSIPLTISFNRRGEPSIADIRMLLCNAACDFGSATPAIADLLHITPTGTVNLLPGGSAVPSFSPPNVTDVPDGTAIRSEVIIEP